MTDHPRFEPIRGTPHDAHRNYNGGRLVVSVLWLVDWWLAARDSILPSGRVARAMQKEGHAQQAK
jgi:hypothetical protein